jgi:hypothetical protein
VKSKRGPPRCGLLIWRLRSFDRSARYVGDSMSIGRHVPRSPVLGGERCPTPNPTSRATLTMPIPLASARRASSILSGSAPGRPSFLRTLPVLLTNLPSRATFSLMTLSQGRTLWRITEPSNSAKAPGRWHVRLCNSGWDHGAGWNIFCWCPLVGKFAIGRQSSPEAA